LVYVLRGDDVTELAIDRRVKKWRWADGDALLVRGTGADCVADCAGVAAVFGVVYADTGNSTEANGQLAERPQRT